MGFIMLSELKELQACQYLSCMPYYWVTNRKVAVRFKKNGKASAIFGTWKAPRVLIFFSFVVTNQAGAGRFLLTDTGNKQLNAVRTVRRIYESDSNRADTGRVPLQLQFIERYRVHKSRPAAARYSDDYFTASGHMTLPVRCLHGRHWNWTFLFWSRNRTVTAWSFQAPFGDPLCFRPHWPERNRPVAVHS